MKNLFKKLMLVAVAAMAFTACSQDVNEVNNVEKVTRYEFTANIADDTRSGFAEKEEGATAYKSEWYGNETLKVFVTDYNNYNVETTASINAKGQFTLELTDAPESFFVTVVSPAEAWESEYTANLPEVQTSGVNSVDPKAHLLQAQAVPVSRDSANAINMTHQIAYGKMTVKGVAFAIDHVVVDLKGSFYGYNREYSYTVKANGVDNTFWFATEPIDVAEFTVTAYDAEGNAVAKTVNVAEAGKTMSFNYGRVGTFSVSGLEEAKETYPVFTSGRWDNCPEMDKKIILTGEGGLEIILNFSNCNNEYFIDPGTYTIVRGGSGPGEIYGGHSVSWAYYTGADGIEGGLLGGTVVVSVVGKEYNIEINDLQLCDNWYNVVGTVPYATFTGAITNMQVPDNRTTLDIPSNVVATVSGKTITLSWDAVEHADGYQVKMWFPYEEEKIEVVNGTQYVFEAQQANTTYCFNVYSYANDENPTYKTSTNWAYVEARTEDTDPKMEVSESKLSFSADGGEKTFTVTLKNTDATIAYTKDGDWFSVDMSGNTFTVNASANESETDGRTGSITLTAGELSQTIAVTQSKKAAEGGGLSGCPADATELTIKDAYYAGFYNPYVEIVFKETDVKIHVFDVYFGGYENISAGTYTSANEDFDTVYTFYDYSGPNKTKPSQIVMNVIANGGDNFTFEVTMVANGNKYYFVYTGDFPMPE